VINNTFRTSSTTIIKHTRGLQSLNSLWPSPASPAKTGDAVVQTTAKGEQMSETQPQSQPRISVSFALDPPYHSFNNDTAPNLIVTLTSQHHKPITIYADDLSPDLMLSCGAFRIVDLATGTDVHQSVRTHCRIPPPSKVQVPLRETLFHTLHPNTPLALSASFGRDRKPLSRYDPSYGEDHNGRGNSKGVDGLVPGSRYLLVAAEKPRIQWNSIRWWDYGTRDQVHNRPDGGLNGREVAHEQGPQPEIVIDPKSVPPIVFECQE
jgi:hypothetical protein